MTTCSICLQECDDTASTLPCNHKFHSDCLVPWLWQHGSCPNCRYTERRQEQTEPDVNIRTFIQEIRAQRAEQTRIFTRNIRLARRTDVPRALKTAIERYRKYFTRVRDTRVEQSALTNIVKRKTQEYNAATRKLYESYVSEYNTLEKQHKDYIRTENTQISKNKQLIFRDQRRIRELRAQIIEFEI